ncbi:unnamed protein product [Trifolium pratense]|uniref:Uncharacterized protein n=1 Tax=Trifolium pratense TaxID=57577 RepID=A0ACB0IWI7_TRIPR|nr:unnamed protein product [Trifolium pratense]
MESSKNTYIQQPVHGAQELAHHAQVPATCPHSAPHAPIAAHGAQIPAAPTILIIVSWNGSPLIESVVPIYLEATTVFSFKSLVIDEHRISIHRTEDSTLPPILNAVEIYVVRQRDALPTFEEDVEAISDVKESYRVQRNWVGDPCEPKNYSWVGLKCNYSTSLPPRIVSLNLSRSNLSGIITPAISNLAFLESLDLSNNNLTGSMPQFLEELKSLKYLNLRGNQLSGFVSTNLQERSKNGLLSLRVDDKNLSGSSNKKKVIAPIIASLTSVLVLLVIAILYWKHRRRNETSKEEMNMINIGSGTVVSNLLAELLMTVHHKNLVSFIGYCDEGDKMALIYEHMANGNLKECLSGRIFHDSDCT